MQIFQRAIVTHGGSGSDTRDSDGPQAAAKAGLDIMKRGKSALDAAVHAVRILEDDPRFNAGNGSRIRADGCTVQMDASCMLSDGNFGAVACVEGILNPISIAQGVLLHSPHFLLVGAGAKKFAEENSIRLLSKSDLEEKKPVKDNESHNSCDTVGAVVFDGTTFAAALSSGGVENAAVGRVGDVPLPGCGLFCGPLGAVACTGDGEFIALKILAREVYGMLERNISPQEAVNMAMTLLDDSVDLGLIILTSNEFASNSRHGMAWSHLTETS